MEHVQYPMVFYICSPLHVLHSFPWDTCIAILILCMRKLIYRGYPRPQSAKSQSWGSVSHMKPSKLAQCEGEENNEEEVQREINEARRKPNNCKDASGEKLFSQREITQAAAVSKIKSKVLITNDEANFILRAFVSFASTILADEHTRKQQA